MGFSGRGEEEPGNKPGGRTSEAAEVQKMNEAHQLIVQEPKIRRIKHEGEETPAVAIGMTYHLFGKCGTLPVLDAAAKYLLDRAFDLGEGSYGERHREAAKLIRAAMAKLDYLGDYLEGK